MNSSDDISTCDKSGNGSGKELSVSTSNKKECTCEQKVDNCNDRASDNTSGDCNSDIDAVAESISKVDISDDNNVEDEKLFAEPPPKEDCPICMQPMPYAVGLCDVRKTYMACCGKFICSGCVMESEIGMKKGNMKRLCAFCRVPWPTSEEMVMQMTNRIGINDPEAYLQLGHAYKDGDKGLPQNFSKAIELWNHAAGLGSINAHYNLGVAYFNGRGVEKDIKKAIKNFKLAAIRGHERSRYVLGLFEEENGNIGIAMKHYIIAAMSGLEDALKEVGKGYKAGQVTKDEYGNTLRAYQDSREDMKSEPRARAVTFWD